MGWGHEASAALACSSNAKSQNAGGFSLGAANGGLPHALGSLLEVELVPREGVQLCRARAHIGERPLGQYAQLRPGREVELLRHGTVRIGGVWLVLLVARRRKNALYLLRFRQRRLLRRVLASCWALARQLA